MAGLVAEDTDGRTGLHRIADGHAHGAGGDHGHEDTAPAVNAAIERIREDQAYDETYCLTAARLTAPSTKPASMTRSRPTLSDV